MKPQLLEIPMPILTPRLMIRPRQVGEGKVLAQAITESLEHLKPWMPFAQEVPTVEQMEEHCRRALSNFVLRADFTLSIYNRAGDVFIGSTGLHVLKWNVPSLAIGYWVHQNFQGQGYVTETVNALTRYVVQVLGARRIEIQCDDRNHRSLAVMRRLGFQQEGVMRNSQVSPDGTFAHMIVTARYDLQGLPALDVQW